MKNIGLDLLGLKINLGSIKSLQEMRDNLKECGAPELLNDKQWRGGLSSIRTGKDIRHIPSSSGFARSAPPPRRVIPAKAKESSWSFVIEKDADMEAELKEWRENKVNGER